MDFDTKKEFVDVLLACPAMRDRNTRNVIVCELPKAGSRITRSEIDQIDVMSIMNRLLGFDDQFTQFIEILRYCEGDSTHMRDVDALCKKHKIGISVRPSDGNNDTSHLTPISTSIRTNPESIAPDEEQMSAIDFFERGNSYDDRGKYKVAISYYDRAIELNPEYINAYVRRGNAYKAQGEYNQAIADYGKVIELSPEYALAYYNRGNAYKAQGMYGQAISDYDKAIEFGPEYALSYNNRGNAYKARGNYNQAILDYDKAIEVDPMLALAYSNRGLVHKERNQYELAISDYKKVVDINPSSTNAYSNLCSLYTRIGQPDIALPYCEKAGE